MRFKEIVEAANPAQQAAIAINMKKHHKKPKNKGVAEDLDEHIVKVKGGYELKSKHGNKNLGKYPTRAGAEKRERQVQYFKHASEGVANGLLSAFKESLEDDQIGGRYDADDFDAMVSRVGQRAKQGPLKTVWDPERRVYKNVPDDKEVDEASLATMRDYFAGDKNAADPTKTKQMRDFFDKNNLAGGAVRRKEFRSPWEYEQWLKLKQQQRVKK